MLLYFAYHVPCGINTVCVIDKLQSILYNRAQWPLFAILFLLVISKENFCSYTFLY